MSKVVIFADGGARGNPGVAGSGTVVYNADRTKILREIAYVVGIKATNNVAEYHGLLRGLEAACELGATDVEFYMDSKLVVEQVSGRWKIKHPDMQELALKARKIITGFDSFSIQWVPRAKNKVADALSNDAMDAAAAGHAPGIVGGDVQQQADDAAGDAAAGDAGAAGDAVAPSDWLADRGPVTTFVLLRHGQTEMSAAKQYCGHADPDLTDLGKRQALAAARALAGQFGTGEQCGIDKLVASPLRRCQQTAAAVAQTLGIEVETADGLIELDFGAWDGLTFTEAHQRDRDIHDQWLHDASVAPPGGESLQALHRRVRTTRRELQQRYSGKRVLVVSHVNPIKSFLRQGLDAGPATFTRLFLDLAGISEVEFWEGGSVVRGVNDVGHLGQMS